MNARPIKGVEVWTFSLFFFPGLCLVHRDCRLVRLSSFSFFFSLDVDDAVIVVRPWVPSQGKRE